MMVGLGTGTARMLVSCWRRPGWCRGWCWWWCVSRRRWDCLLAYLVLGFRSKVTLRLGSVATLVWNSVRPL